MKKLFKTSVFLLALFVVTMVSAVSLRAQTQITFGQTYTVNEGGNFDGVFDLTEACTLAVYVTGDTGTMFEGTSDDAEMIFFNFETSDFSSVPKKLIYNMPSAGTYAYKLQTVSETSTYRFEIEDDATGGGGSAGGPITIAPGETYNVNPFAHFEGDLNATSAGPLTVFVGGVYSQYPAGVLYNSLAMEVEQSGPGVMNDDDGGTYVTYQLSEPGTYTYSYDNSMSLDAIQLIFSFENASGGGDSENGVLPVPATNFTLSETLYTYTPSENGILTIEYENQPWDNCLYSSWGDSRQRVALQDGIDPNTAKVFKWALEGGHTYYLDSSYPANNVVTTSFEVTGGGNQGGDEEGAYSPVELNKEYTIEDGEILAVYFKPASNGTLKISQWGTDDPFLFLAPTENPEDYSNMAPNDGYMGSDPCVFTYNVAKGTTYYYYGVHNSAQYRDLNKVMFEFDGDNGGGNENPNQPGELPEGFEAMEMKSYSVTGVGSVKLAFTPYKSGTLIVTQTGDFDSHLYNIVPSYDATYGYGTTTPIQTQGDGGYSGENPYTLKYGVAAGVTYYYVAKTNTYDGISAVSFEFEEASNDNVIVLDTPYVVNYQSPIYTFTPEETGILTVSWTNPNPGGEPALGTTFYQGSNQFFLYSDYGLSHSLPMLNHVEIENVGCKVTFNVVAGENYYLKLDALNKWQCVFTLEAGDLQAAAVQQIEPVPGTAYDTVNFQYYWNLILAPNEPTLDKVTLTYVPSNDPTGNPTTIDLSTQVIDGGVFPPYEFGGDAMRISAIQLNSLLSHNEIANETDIVFTIYGLKAAGEYVTENLMVQGDDYVTIGENGLVTVTYKCGTPIALLTQNWPDPFLSGWERGDKAGIATLTYDKEIYHVGAVTVTQGHQYYGSEGGGDTPPYSVTLPAQNVTWAGNTVTIDFTGINFNMPSGTSEVTITVSGPTGQNGLNASYDGIPVLQHYAKYTTDGSVVIPENIINYIEPRDGVTFGGLFEGEPIIITLMDNVKERTENLTGVLSEENGEVLGTFGFMQAVGDRWIYELQEGENFIFVEGHTYLFTVTATDAANQTIGSQVVYWYGDAEDDAVNAIEANDGEYVVYNINGVRVLVTKNAADLNNLSKGLYIINGKKVVK